MRAPGRPAAVALLVLLALLVRGHRLGDSGIQNDEQIWHERSARFFQTIVEPFGPETYRVPEVYWPREHVDLTRRSLAFNDYPFTIKMPAPHPGTPAGFLMGACYALLGEDTTSWSLEWAPVLEVTRYPGVVLGALLVLIVYAGGRRLVGERAALFAAALVAVEPMLIGFSRLARIDLSGAVFTTAGVLAYLAALPERRPRWLAASGICTGLATATNPYGLFAVPAIVACRQVLTRPTPLEIVQAHGVRFWRGLERADRLWLWTFVATFVLVYPNLWPNPLLGLWEIVEGILRTPHVRGEQSTLMPVSHLFYVVRSPQHLLPWTLALAAVGAAAVRRPRPLEARILFVWGAGILLLLSLPPGRKNLKNFLPVVPVIALLAGAGLDRLLARIERGRPAALRTVLSVAAAAALVAGGLATTARWWPYPVLYTWPWLADPQTQELRELLGEGEGVKEAMAFIQREGPEGARVGTFTGKNNAAYYHPAELLVPARRPEDLAGLDWLIVLPKLTFAGPDSDALVAWVRAHEPTHVIRHRQIELVRIYRLQ